MYKTVKTPITIIITVFVFFVNRLIQVPRLLPHTLVFGPKLAGGSRGLISVCFNGFPQVKCEYKSILHYFPLALWGLREGIGLL